MKSMGRVQRAALELMPWAIGIRALHLARHLNLTRVRASQVLRSLVRRGLARKDGMRFVRTGDAPPPFRQVNAWRRFDRAAQLAAQDHGVIVWRRPDRWGACRNTGQNRRTLIAAVNGRRAEIVGIYRTCPEMGAQQIRALIMEDLAAP